VGDNQIETMIDDKWLTLLPNKKLIVGKANVEERLNCNLSSLEVIQIIEKKAKERTTTQTASATKTSHSSNSEKLLLCELIKNKTENKVAFELGFLNIIFNLTHLKRNEKKEWNGRYRLWGTWFEVKYYEKTGVAELLFEKGQSTRVYSRVAPFKYKCGSDSGKISKPNLASATDLSRITVLENLARATALISANNNKVENASPSATIPELAVSDSIICDKAVDFNGNWTSDNDLTDFVEEAKRRGLSCGVKEASNTQIASTTAPSPNSVSSTDLTAAQRKAERLETELAALKADQQQEQQRVDSDTQIPLITILSSSSNDRRGSIAGRATDNIGIAEVRVDGVVVPLKSDGRFEWQGFVPSGGLSVVIEAIDTAGLSSMQQVRLERGQQNNSSGPLFDELNPFRGKTAKKNRNALALIVGVSDYERTPDPAIYADKDAQYFQDYAAIKLGVPDNNIFTLINRDADRIEIKKAVKSWLLRMSVKNETDVYVFFAGHGLASSDGSNMFLLPYDGDPELLEDSAIDRKQLFADIQAISPRSVTIFLDSCYSGGTRAGGTLVANLRPIAIRAKE
jgi:hypothetical protein